MYQPKVHVHTSAPDAFLVNSFIVEGERSLVLVDTQFVMSEAKALIDRIDALKKPLASIIITRVHPWLAEGRSRQWLALSTPPSAGSPAPPCFIPGMGLPDRST